MICPLAAKSLVLVTMRRVHYGKMGKVPTTIMEYDIIEKELSQLYYQNIIFKLRLSKKNIENTKCDYRKENNSKKNYQIRITEKVI